MVAARAVTSGDPCPACAAGRLCVYHTHVVDRGEASYRLRYLWCGSCHHTPAENKVQVPLRFAPSRGSRPRKLTVRRR